MLLRLAWRNVRRNRRRSLYTTSTLGLAGALMVAWGTLSEGYYRFMLDAATAYELGDAVVQDPGDGLLTPTPSQLDQLDSLQVAWAPRIRAPALAVVGGTSMGVELRAIDPEREPKVTRILQHIDRGSTVSSDAPDGVLLGSRLASALSVEPGDILPVVGQGFDGSLASYKLRIRGILRPTSRVVDQRAVYVCIDTFRRIMVAPTGVGELALRWPASLHDQDRTIAMQSLRRAFGPERVRGWRELQPGLGRTIDLLGLSVFFTLAVTYVALGGIIFNVILMSVLERMYEFGVMKALGMLPRQIFALISIEAGVLALKATLIMLLFGLPMGFYFAWQGIDLRGVIHSLSFAGIAFEPVLHGHLGMAQVLRPIGFLLAVTWVAALFPALKAARIPPLEAMVSRT